MSCNCEGNTYNIGMGCCKPVVANPNIYYTKSEIDKIVEDIEAGEVDLSDYYTKEETEGLLEGKLDASAYTPTDLTGYATEQWVEDKGYLTEHQPMKTINNQVITGTGNITIEGTDPDLSDYYDKSEVDSMMGGKLDVTAYTPTDLSQYWTSAQTQSAITAATSGIPSSQTIEQLRTDVNTISGDVADKADASALTAVSNALTAHTANTSVHVSQQEKNVWNAKLDATAYTPTDLTGYATEQWVQNQGYLTEHQSLSGYATTATTNAISNSLTAHTANTSVHVTSQEKSTWNSKVDQSTLNNYMLKSQIWCGTEAEYNAITVKDNDVIYLIHE